MVDWINRVAKWRSTFAGWQLGTRSSTDPECQAVRDHRECTILHRCELSAIAALLVQKGIFTAEEFTDQVHEEARLLDREFQARFPGFKSTDIGMAINTAVAHDTTAGWRP